MPETKQMLFHFTPAVRDAIKAYASMRDITMNAGVRQLIAAGLMKEAADLKRRAAEKEASRDQILRVVEKSRSDSDLGWLSSQLDGDPHLPTVDEIPEFVRETYTDQVELLEEANQIMDLSLKVQRST